MYGPLELESEAGWGYVWGSIEHENILRLVLGPPAEDDEDDDSVLEVKLEGSKIVIGSMNVSSSADDKRLFFDVVEAESTETSVKIAPAAVALPSWATGFLHGGADVVGEDGNPYKVERSDPGDSKEKKHRKKRHHRKSGRSLTPKREKEGRRKKSPSLEVIDDATGEEPPERSSPRKKRSNSLSDGDRRTQSSSSGRKHDSTSKGSGSHRRRRHAVRPVLEIEQADDGSARDLVVSHGPEDADRLSVRSSDHSSEFNDGWSAESSDSDASSASGNDAEGHEEGESRRHRRRGSHSSRGSRGSKGSKGSSGSPRHKKKSSKILDPIEEGKDPTETKD